MRVRKTFQCPSAAWLPIPAWVMIAVLVEAAIAIALLVWQILLASWPTL